MSQAKHVELVGVSVRIGVATILRGVDLVIRPGEAVGVFGANGAGKTTLLRLMAAQLAPDAGRATVLGIDIATDDRIDIRHRIGTIGHTPALYPELTLAENLGFAAAVSGVTPGRVGDVLATVGLAGASGRRAAVCSHGMQRRAEIARELMLEPDLLLLDEPHSALDAAASDLVEHLVRTVTGRGGAAVLASHDRERVAKIVDRTVEVAGGGLQ